MFRWFLSVFPRLMLGCCTSRMKNGPIFHPGTISHLSVPRRRQNATLGTDLPISVPGAAARLSFRQRCEPIMMKID